MSVASSRTAARLLRGAACLIMMSLLLVFTPDKASAADNPVQPQAALAINPCDLIPNPLGQKLCNEYRENGGVIPPSLDFGLSSLLSIADDPTEVIADAFFGRIAEGMFGSVAVMLKKMFEYIDASTAPAFTDNWFIKLWGWSFAAGIGAAFLGMVGRTARGAKELDGVEIIKGPMMVIIVIAFGGIIPAYVGGLTWSMDSIASDSLLPESEQNLDTMFEQFKEAMLSTNQYSSLLFAPILVALLGLIGGILMVIEFTIREYALYVVTVWVVITFGLSAGGRTQTVQFIRTTIMLHGLIFFKVIAGTILWIGTSMAASQGQNSDPIIIGSLLLLSLPVLTWMAFKKVTHYDPPVMKYVGSVYRRLSR